MVLKTGLWGVMLNVIEGLSYFDWIPIDYSDKMVKARSKAYQCSSRVILIPRHIL